jgi:hypothetical protein
MNTFLDYLNLFLLVLLLFPLSVFLWWNWQYRNLGNGFRLMRTTIQHWVGGLFYLVLYLTLRRLALMLGWEYPAWINQAIASILFIYLLFRTWNSLLIFKGIRDGELQK